jgi:hypothetical protein
VMTRPALAGAPAHPKDEPFVEPQTYSLVKEQLTYLFTTPVVTGGSVDKSSRRTRASQPNITAADLSRFDANVATTKKRQAENPNRRFDSKRKLRQASSSLSFSLRHRLRQ